MIEVVIDAHAFAPDALLARFEPDGADGAVASFAGFCRDDGGTLSALELEHYPAMAHRQLEDIAKAAASRFGVGRLFIQHRVGMIKPGEAIVFVAATSRHRDAAFDAVRFVMDYLKTDAPFWKKQHLKKGGDAGWVAARDSDDNAKDKWSA